MTLNPQLSPIWQRRSVRRYQSVPVPEAVVHDLLAAAMAAPSAAATDPWRFVVVRRSELLVGMAELLPYGKMLASAPVAVVVAGDEQAALSRQLSYLLQDCSAAIENLLLAASLLGLGSCWLGVHPRAEHINGLRALLQIPPTVIPVGCISLGYPAEFPEPRTRFNSAYVHEDIW